MTEKTKKSNGWVIYSDVDHTECRPAKILEQPTKSPLKRSIEKLLEACDNHYQQAGTCEGCQNWISRGDNSFCQLDENRLLGKE